MKTASLALVLSLAAFAPPHAAPTPTPAETTLTLRITSAVPGMEVPVEGYYLFRPGQAQRVDGRTPLEFSATSDYVSALVRNREAQNRVRVELLRNAGRPEALLLSASGRVVRISTGEPGEAPHQVNAF